MSDFKKGEEVEIRMYDDKWIDGYYECFNNGSIAVTVYGISGGENNDWYIETDPENVRKK